MLISSKTPGELPDNDPAVDAMRIVPGTAPLLLSMERLAGTTISPSSVIFPETDTEPLRRTVPGTPEASIPASITKASKYTPPESPTRPSPTLPPPVVPAVLIVKRAPMVPAVMVLVD